MKNNILLFIYLYFLTAFALLAQPQWKNDQLIIENNKIKHTIGLEKGKIIPTVFSKELKKDLISPESSTPWFEFSVNGKLIKANEEVWKFR